MGEGALGTAPGSLDTTFGTGGIVTTNPTLIGGNPNAPDGGVVGTLTAIEQSNGDIAVVTGINTTAFPGLEVFGLVRYTSDGTLIGATTASFFTDGVSSPIAVAVQSNCDVVVVVNASASIDHLHEVAMLADIVALISTNRLLVDRHRNRRILRRVTACRVVAVS
jgi:hypothetical protein